MGIDYFALLTMGLSAQWLLMAPNNALVAADLFVGMSIDHFLLAVTV
jgi:hypothetical protein